ncbi:MAG TPA: phosphotransferase [Gammaproteobacteria bacterium]|nr:phosphotransferase [Gammaproteobacteria bacterium]
MAAPQSPNPPAAVLQAFGLAPDSLARATSGLINPTWYARSTQGAELVLQRVNPIFPAKVNLDIAAVTEHLARKGLLTPRLVPTRAGALWLEHEGAVWRVLTRIEGVCRDALESPAQAREAGRALAEFHRAVADLDYTFQNARLGVHDTPKHLENLRDALVEHAAHRDIAAIRPLAERVLTLAAALPPLPPCGDRIVHGDPKISNLMFDGDRALCLIDLDTLSRMPVALELGDALRSWCNPAREDAKNARFVREYFQAAVGGYAAAAQGFLTENEWRAIPLGTLMITVELAARFCADALRERYFGWDATRYASASDHNQARTRGQLQVATSLAAEMGALEGVTARAFGA